MGSGGHNRKKGNITQYRHIDIRFMQQHRCLKQPSNFYLSWGTNRKILCNYDGYSLDLYFDLNNSGCRIKIDKTRTNYGYRAWFICPGCGKRTMALYYRWNYYGCRICQSLNYSSSQQSHNRMEQVNRKIYKIQDRLQAEHDPLIYYSIPKPKRMHYRTYEKLLDRLAELDEQSGNAFVSECEKRLGIKL